MSRPIYATRKAAGVCTTCGSPDRITAATCLPCLFRERDGRTNAMMPAQRAVFRLEQQQRAHVTFLAALAEPVPVGYAGNEVGCCQGQFYLITTLPFRSPCCGRIFFQEE